MNQTAIGSYIARKRKEQNLTQEQLAEQLDVSKTTSGTDVQDFILGILMGLSVVEILAGIGIVGELQALAERLSALS